MVEDIYTNVMLLVEKEEEGDIMPSRVLNFFADIYLIEKNA